MRLWLQMTPNSQPVPYNHLDVLGEKVRGWMGDRWMRPGEHNLLSFGWLCGGRARDGHLAFEKGAEWRLSFYRKDDAHQVLRHREQNPRVLFGMEVAEVDVIPVPSFGQSRRFLTDMGPILARNPEMDGGHEYLLWSHKKAGEVLTSGLRSKLERVGFTGEHLGVKVSFDRSFRRAHSKRVDLNGEQHRGSVCPVFITGTPEALAFAWAVGIGDLTAYGFGALR